MNIMIVGDDLRYLNFGPSFFQAFFKTTPGLRMLDLIFVLVKTHTRKRAGNVVSKSIVIESVY